MLVYKNILKANILQIVLAVIFLAVSSSCEFQVPERQMFVKTDTIISIRGDQAEVGGEIIDPGRGISAYGHCWSLTPEPLINSYNTRYSLVLESYYASLLTDLLVGEKYYVRAYALNDEVISYGKTISFIAGKSGIPTVQTYDVILTGSNSISCGGYVLDTGGGTIIMKGMCWNTQPRPTTDHFKSIIFSVDNNIDDNISGLEPNTTYYFRAYATNEFGTGYGEEKKITIPN